MWHQTKKNREREEGAFAAQWIKEEHQGFCLVLLRLRRSISRSVQISTSVLLSHHVLKLLLKLVLWSWVSNIQLLLVVEIWLWCKKTTTGKCLCRKKALKRVKDKKSGIYIQIQNVVLHVVSGQKLPNPWILSLAEGWTLELRTVAGMKPFWVPWGAEGINEYLCS